MADTFPEEVFDDLAKSQRKPTFTKENFDNLIHSCKNIISISEENIDGNLMMVQLMCLADDIKEFKDNPIVKNSGI
jgi:hypothetical protein